MHSRLSVLMPQCWWEVLQGLLIQNPTHQDHNNAQIQCSPGAEWFSLQESGFIPSFLVINQPTNLHPRPPLDETWTLVDQSLPVVGEEPVSCTNIEQKVMDPDPVLMDHKHNVALRSEVSWFRGGHGSVPRGLQSTPFARYWTAGGGEFQFQ